MTIHKIAKYMYIWYLTIFIFQVHFSFFIEKNNILINNDIHRLLNLGYIYYIVFPLYQYHFIFQFRWLICD